MAGDAGTIVGRNLERVYGRPLSDIEKKRKIAETFEWYGRYYVESFRLPDVSVDELDRGFSYDGSRPSRPTAARASPAQSSPCPTSERGNGRRSGCPRHQGEGDGDR